MRAPTRLLVLLLLGLLSGCTTLDRATRDETRLWGEVPAGLGRILEVRLEGIDEETRAELMQALEREFVSRSLFERVRHVASDSDRAAYASSLSITLISTKANELFDMFNFEDAFVARYEMKIQLKDEKGRSVLEGHISGIGVDQVTDEEHLDQEKRTDVRVAALHDAAMKMSRALRQAANARASKALETLTPIRLAEGIGPLGLAVLGFDDDKTARRRHGPNMRDHLARAMRRLGTSVRVVTSSNVRRALEREPDVQVFADLPQYKLERLIPHLPGAGLFLVGKVSATGGKVRATVRVIDRRGREIATKTAEAKGLGALRVVSVKLARGLGKAFEGLKR